VLYKLAGWWPLASRGAMCVKMERARDVAPAIDTGTLPGHLDAFLARLAWRTFLEGLRCLQTGHRSLWHLECVAASPKVSHSDRSAASHHCGIRQRSDTGPTAVRPARVALGHWRQSDKAKATRHGIAAPQRSFHGRIAHLSKRCRSAKTHNTHHNTKITISNSPVIAQAERTASNHVQRHGRECRHRPRHDLLLCGCVAE
jgi:hypothetical protein